MEYLLLYVVVGLILALFVARYVDSGSHNDDAAIFVLNIVGWPLIIITMIVDLLFRLINPFVDLMIRLSRFGRKK